MDHPFAIFQNQNDGNINKLRNEMKNKDKIIETLSQEISQLKEDMKSLIKSMNALKEYCLELQKIGDDQQKILEEVCKENIEIKKRLQILESKVSTKVDEVSNPKFISPVLPPLPSLSQLIKN